MNLEKVLNIAEFRELARRRLPRGIFEYVDRGTEDELALGVNRRALDGVALHPSVLVDISKRDLATKVLGVPQPSPLVIAPTAVAGLLWHDGEIELARAAAAAGIPFCVSTQSMTAIERIAAETKAKLWFQLYVWRNRQRTYDLIARAKAAGADTLILTVDTALSPKKEYNTRNGFGIPIEPSLTAGLDVLCHPRWLGEVLLKYLASEGMPTYAHYPPEFRTKITRLAIAEEICLADDVSWADVKELRRRWSGKFVIKGILRPDDAVTAADHGADAIVVSNHGGRNLDAAPSPVSVLPKIVDAVGHRLEVFADSGVRRGSDVVKYLALGAKAVLVGRAVLFGTAVAGEAGATRVLAILEDEIDRTLAFLGRRTISEVGRDLVQVKYP